MAIELTQEQKAAVYAPVSENLVSAAAGSGKTKVLSERIAQRIRSGDTTIDRLLIVTFTRAAAMQMKERIASAIENEYVKTKNSSLKRQLSMISGADICTIDSFCINLVKKNFFKIDVAPDFVIADANEMRILREEVMTDVLEAMYDKAEEGFITLSDSVGNGKSDDELKQIILKAYFFTRSFSDSKKWLNMALECHRAGSKENDRLYDFLLEEILDAIEEMGSMLYRAKAVAEDALVTSYLKVLDAECERYEAILRHCTRENVGDAIEGFAFSSFSGGRKKGEEGFLKEKDEIKALHNDAKELFGEIQELWRTACTKRGLSYQKIEALVDCVMMFDELYMAEKKARKVLEFSDCEYLAYKLLKENEDVTDELRDKYDEIYIDEYQDTNPLQDELFTLLSRKSRGEANLFIVGDVKQSIYRFRHSDPRVFSEKAKTFGSDEMSRKMILSKNFRSREAVIDSINCVFEKIMHECTAQVEYDEEHRLKAGAAYVEYNQNKSELYILKNKYDDNEEDENLLREERETLVAAKRIRELMDSGFMVSDGGRMRPVRYSDIAVLSSRINNKADAVTKIFELMDIPVYCESKQSFFAALEVQTVVSLLRCVDNPLCDIPLASVMRSPVFSFGENELAEIRQKGREKSFYSNVLETAEEDTALGEKCRSFLETMQEWRTASGIMSLEKFVTRLIDESGYYSFVGALPGGGARQANLRQFMSLAASFSQNKFKSLYSFVRYIDKTIETGGEVEVDGGGAQNSVLVASIHKSKGLEYPVVIVIGCGGKFIDSDSYASLIMTPEYGMAVAEREKTRRVKFKTAEYKAISMMLTRENHAEQMRLLYVAMTRAKEKLIMIGSALRFDEKAAEGFEGKSELSDYKIRNMKTYLDYLFESVDEKYWDMYFVNELPVPVQKEEEVKEEEAEEKISEEVVYRLSYFYPHDGVRNIPSKMSVSEIKKLSMDEEATLFYKNEPEKRVPAFMKGKEKLTGANRGTAYHRVMELIEPTEKDAKGAILSFVEKGMMTKEQAECIDAVKIEAFLSSELAERMKKAKWVMREESFTILIDAKDVFPEGEDEKICVQGTIDCLFEDEDGKIVLLDYKTDFYTEEEEIVKRYKKQLELYETAVFMRYKKNCDEKCLYMFHSGDIIEV